MHFEGRRKKSALPNLTPLIDVVFLLLVFFMLTSHFVREEVIPLDLPEADSGEARTDQQQLQLTVNGDGTVLLHDHIVEMDALEAVLRRELQARDNKIVRLRGDRNVSLGATVSIIDVARKAGASGVDIVSQER